MASKTILVADDNRFIRILVRAALGPLECDVIEAEDGQEALDAVRAHHPDVLLLDVVMPRMSGFDVLEAVRADHAYDDMVIAMLTTSATQVDIKHGKDAGANDYIVKPFDNSVLRSTVKSLLQI